MDADPQDLLAEDLAALALDLGQARTAEEVLVATADAGGRARARRLRRGDDRPALRRGRARRVHRGRSRELRGVAAGAGRRSGRRRLDDAGQRRPRRRPDLRPAVGPPAHRRRPGGAAQRALGGGLPAASNRTLVLSGYAGAPRVRVRRLRPGRAPGRRPRLARARPGPARGRPARRDDLARGDRAGGRTKEPSSGPRNVSAAASTGTGKSSGNCTSSTWPKEAEAARWSGCGRRSSRRRRVGTPAAPR